MGPDFFRASENRGGSTTCDAGRQGLLNCDVEWPSLPGVVRGIRVGCGPDVALATRSGWVSVGLHLGGYLSQMADPDPHDSDLLQRAKQAQSQSKALREQVARSAEAVAETEQDVARVHRKLADQGGPLAAEAREHADRAEDFAAKERAEAERLRRAEPG
jgi:uncharacterized membrane-anchored protein YhcB (DUF1043 family)